ncbi:MAG TPA: universal stress protein [Gemmataceae bacterium]|nr:universal stress protein [Gemmataceae bacterium]
MLKNRLILCPTDFSSAAAVAFDLACGLARDYGAGVTVLHVARPPVSLAEVAASERPGFRASLHARLHEIRPTESAVTVTHMLTEGDPAENILETARGLPCDLIVMGTHGRSGLGRLVLGSVAEDVLRAAPCPVLTVRAPLPPPEPVAPEDLVGPLP